jgi:hypothetical protein
LITNPKEERFFASDSLKNVLKPEMLESPTVENSNFSLSVSDKTYKLTNYAETKRELIFQFSTSADKLAPVLNLKNSIIKIMSGETLITKDVSSHDVSYEVVNLTDNDYKVTVSFTKNQLGVLHD